MISPAAAAGIALVALGLVLAPGPNMLYLVSRTLTQGRRAGLVSLLALGFAVQELPPDRPRKLLATGLLTNLLNPKIAVLYVALLPQVAVALTVNAGIVLSAAGLARLLGRRPSWLRVRRLVMGGVLAARLLTQPAPG